jgi:hypothetical protein
MKYLLFFLGIPFIISCTNTDNKTAFSKKNAEDALKDSANYTSIQWIDPVVQDLGKAKEGQVLEIDWKFKNTGNKPLVIADVHPGCGCTLADKPEEPIAPGKEGQIKAKFDTHGHPGNQFKQVFIRANNSNKNGEGEDVLAFKVDVAKQ